MKYNILLILKLLVAIEYNYSNYKRVIDLFTVVINLLIVILLLFMTFKFSFQVTSYKKVDNYGNWTSRTAIDREVSIDTGTNEQSEYTETTNETRKITYYE